MEERRASLRARCSISLSYKLLNEAAQQAVLYDFASKRKRLMLYDQLDHNNKKENFKLHTLESDLAHFLIGQNDQIRLLIDTLGMDFDILHKQPLSDVVINLGGMQFNSDEVLAKGSVLELQIRLSLSMPRILIMAEVLRSGSVAESDNTVTVVSFTYIEPEDKIILKNHVDDKIKEDKSILVK